MPPRPTPRPNSSEPALSGPLARVDVVDRLDPADVDAVAGLLAAASAADGLRPVSEESELRMRHGGPAGGRNLLLRAPGALLAGYARWDDGQAELVIAPDARRQGFGSELLAAVEQLAGDSPVSVWAHGDLPGARALAEAREYTRERVLLQMRRDLAGVDPDPRPALPDDVQVHPFVVGRDETAWLRINAAAFAAHPEQGSWTAEDVALREAEPWFDPAGFLLAWRGDPSAGGELLGFHWTKIHPAGDVDTVEVGEIYVLGVAPAAQGLRLGRALTDLGLAHLRTRGLADVLLYVEEDNTAAVHLYESCGFRRHSVDVAWHRG